MAATQGIADTEIYEYESKSQLHTIAATPDSARDGGIPTLGVMEFSRTVRCK
jgi:hypothetical protein